MFFSTAISIEMVVHKDFGAYHLNAKCYFLAVWAISSFCTAIFNGIAMEVGTDALFILTPVGTKVRFLMVYLLPVT